MNFEISHAVDDSDVAFVMRLDRKSTICSMMSSRSTHYHKVGTNIDAFINLATVNYLLAGLQLCYSRKHHGGSKWFDLLHDLDQERYPEPGVQLTLWDLRYILRELIVPFGVVRGSEKQGGQDETGLSPATWPVNFVCNMVLDGHDRNVLNYWHYHDVSAGDDLVFRLKPMPIPKGKNGYTLNHYYKRFVQQNFESYFLSNFGETYATHVWQLVPDVFSLDCKPENDHRFGQNGVRMSPGFGVPQDYVWQEHGFWHIARSQVMVRKYALTEYYNDDMANQMKTSHLDVTFEPTYTKAPGETRDPKDDRAVTHDVRDWDARVPDDKWFVKHRDASGVYPGMMADVSHGAWAPELFLEGAGGSRADAGAAGGGLGGGATHDMDLALGALNRPRPPRERDPSPAVEEEINYGIIFTEPPELGASMGAAEVGGSLFEPFSEQALDMPLPPGLASALPPGLEGADLSLPFSDPPELPEAQPSSGQKQGRKRKQQDPQT